MCVSFMGKRLCAHAHEKPKVERSTRIRHTNGNASFNTCWCNQVKDDVKNFVCPCYSHRRIHTHTHTCTFSLVSSSHCPFLVYSFYLSLYNYSFSLYNAKPLRFAVTEFSKWLLFVKGPRRLLFLQVQFIDSSGTHINLNAERAGKFQ